MLDKPPSQSPEDISGQRFDGVFILNPRRLIQKFQCLNRKHIKRLCLPSTLDSACYSQEFRYCLRQPNLNTPKYFLFRRHVERLGRRLIVKVPFYS